MEDVRAASSEQLDSTVNGNPSSARVSDTDASTDDAEPRSPSGGEVESGVSPLPALDAPPHATGEPASATTVAEPEANPALDAAPEPASPDVEAPEPVIDADAAPVPATTRSARPSRLEQLEREGEAAADFLERLLDIADLDGDIDVDIDGDRAAVAVVDSEEGRVPRRLVGPDGQVLEALQELTRLAVETVTGERSRLMLDVAGYRAQRRAALVDLARTAIEEVRESGKEKALADMSAFERKVVHDEVTAAGLVSQSEGVEPHRHIVISPR